ncbi:MAG TPA: PhoH family protein [Phycisphaerales bacterium]|nr:PhoH family protein [Phycisphaerales bacterium]
MIRESFGVNVGARDGTLSLRGEPGGVAAAQRVVEGLIESARRGRTPSQQQVRDAIAESGWKAQRGGGGGGGAPAQETGDTAWGDRLEVYSGGRAVAPKTENQRAYLDAIRDHDLVFGIGPAGTGKTYLAVAAAIHLLKVGRVRRAILARPAVEAGEKLGFLPGDQYAKVNPYLRPLLDSLHDMMDYPTLSRFMSTDVLEVVPLAYMRGRTLNDAVIILDEAQNTTRTQMQMFLTRMGQRSKMIVTGDTTQIDLDDPRDSGLVDAARRLKRVAGVALRTLDKSDVVRHELVQRIIEAYEPGPSMETGERGAEGGGGSGEGSGGGGDA